MSTQHFIMATAGHVDHGKSSLIKALTGTDPDRLPEEKARGITIDLGFAHLEVPAPASIDSPLLDQRPVQADSTRSAATVSTGVNAYSWSA